MASLLSGEFSQRSLREALIREKKRFFVKSLHKMVTPPPGGNQGRPRAARAAKNIGSCLGNPTNNKNTFCHIRRVVKPRTLVIKIHNQGERELGERPLSGNCVLLESACLFIDSLPRYQLCPLNYSQIPQPSHVTHMG